MSKVQQDLSISESFVVNKIYTVGKHNIMLDSDLAELYKVETKRLNEQVKRNLERFPPDFMFQLSDSEWESLRSQIATSKSSRGGRKYLPYVFTEHGVLMLSSVLNSPLAIQINIQIVRIFSKMHKSLTNSADWGQEINEINERLLNHDKNIELVFSYLDELIEKKANPKSRQRIGYMPDEI